MSSMYVTEKKASNLRKTVLIVSLAVANSSTQATDISGGETIVADDPTGLFVDLFGGGGPIEVTIDSNAEGDGLTLGAGPSAIGTPAIFIGEFAPIGDLTVTVDSSGAGNDVIFAGDVVSDQFMSNIFINSVDSNLVFQGNVYNTPMAFSPIAITLGNAGAATLSMTVDTVNNEDLVIDATIDADAAGDSISLNVANTDGNVNGILFTRAIGGTVALDAINLGDATDVTFDDTVDVGAGTITFNGSAIAGFSQDVTGNINFAAGNTAEAYFGPDAGLTGAITATTDGEGAVYFSPAFSDTTLVSGTIGTATEALASVNVITSFNSGVTSLFNDRVDANTINIVGGPGAVTFAGIVDAITINVDGAATTNFNDDVTGNVAFADGNLATVNVAADKAITGNVTAATAGEGVISFAAPTANKTVVSGSIGAGNALAAVNIATGAGITTTMGGTVAANMINITGTGTTRFPDDVTGALNFNGDATASLAANAKIVGSVTTATDGQGTLAFDQTTVNTQLVSGSIGSSSAAIRALNIDIAAAVEVTLGDDVYADNIGVTGVGTLVAQGDVTTNTLNVANDATVKFTSGNNFTGNMITAADNAGTLEFSGGTSIITGNIGDVVGNAFKALTVGSGASGDSATFSGNIAAKNIFVNNLATFSTARAITVNAQTGFTNNGILALSDTLTLTGGGTAELGGSINSALVMLSDSYANNTVVNAAQMTTVDTTNTITVTPHAAFVNGSLILLDTNAGTGSADDRAKYTVTGSSLADYTISVDANNDVILTAEPRATTLTTPTSTQLVEVAANNIKQLAKTTQKYNTATGVVYNSKSSANSYGDSSPGWAKVTDGTTGTDSATTSTSNDVLGDRGVEGVAEDLIKHQGREEEYEKKKKDLDDSKESDEKTGNNSGDALFADSSFWAALYTDDGEKKDNNGAGGYDSDSDGLVIGWNRQYGSGKSISNVGASLGYSSSNIDFKSTSMSASHTDAVMASVTGSRNIGENYYGLIEWVVAYGRNRNEAKRMTPANSIASAKYDSRVLFADLTYLVPMNLYSWSVTPKTGLSWTSVSNEGYAETGAGGLNMQVGSTNSKIVTATAGADFARYFNIGKGILVPKASVYGSYDVKNDAVSVTGGLVSGGPIAAMTGAKPEKLGLNVGLGLAFSTKDETHSWGIDYLGDFKPRYRNHTASLSYRLKF